MGLVRWSSWHVSEDLVEHRTRVTLLQRSTFYLIRINFVINTADSENVTCVIHTLCILSWSYNESVIGTTLTRVTVQTNETILDTTWPGDT